MARSERCRGGQLWRRRASPGAVARTRPATWRQAAAPSLAPDESSPLRASHAAGTSARAIRACLACSRGPSPSRCPSSGAACKWPCSRSWRRPSQRTSRAQRAWHASARGGEPRGAVAGRDSQRLCCAANAQMRLLHLHAISRSRSIFGLPLITPLNTFTVAWMSIITLIDLTYAAFWVSAWLPAPVAACCSVTVRRGPHPGSGAVPRANGRCPSTWRFAPSRTATSALGARAPTWREVRVSGQHGLSRGWGKAQSLRQLRSASFLRARRHWRPAGVIYTIHMLLNFSVGIVATHDYKKRLVMGALLVKGPVAKPARFCPSPPPPGGVPAAAP